MIFLENEVIKLRPPEHYDLDTLYLWENDTTFWQRGATIAPYSRDILKKYLETIHLDIYETRQLRFMIELKRESRPVGMIDLYDFEPFHQRAGVGVLIASPEDRQKRYASYALEILKTYSFDFLGLHVLYSHIATDNEASVKLFLSVGFNIVGTLKQWSRRGNLWYDELVLQLIQG